VSLFVLVFRRNVKVTGYLSHFIILEERVYFLRVPERCYEI